MDSTLTGITQTGADGTPAASGVKVDYGYAPDGLLLSRTPAGGQVEHVTWNRLAGIARMLALADTEFVYGLGQGPVAQTTAGKADVDGLVWLHTDRLGSVVATTDSAGATVGAGMVGKAAGKAGRKAAGARKSRGGNATAAADDDVPQILKNKATTMTSVRAPAGWISMLRLGRTCKSWKLSQAKFRCLPGARDESTRTSTSCSAQPTTFGGPCDTLNPTQKASLGQLNQSQSTSNREGTKKYGTKVDTRSMMNVQRPYCRS